MFELILMRHAKSDWHSHTADIDRPLNDRGVEDAIRMGARLKQLDLVPDKMVVSAAQRTRETASLLLDGFSPVFSDEDENVIIDSQLYLAGTETLCETIELYASENRRLMILAHNPGLDYLVSFLASSPPALSSSGKLMTTCSAACFLLDSPDSVRKQGQGVLQHLIRPKEL